MSLHHRIAMLAAASAAIGAVIPMAGASASPNREGGALAPPAVAHHVVAPAGTHSTTARLAAERAWQQINDAMLPRLLNRP